jgi:hypothetical protein
MPFLASSTHFVNAIAEQFLPSPGLRYRAQDGGLRHRIVYFNKFAQDFYTDDSLPVLHVVAGRWWPEHFDIPCMIRMNEAVPALFICELAVNEEPRPYWMRTSQRFEKTHAQIWRKSLARNGANMNVAVQSTAAFQVRLYNNEDIRLIWLTHSNSPILSVYTIYGHCRPDSFREIDSALGQRGLNTCTLADTSKPAFHTP